MHFVAMQMNYFLPFQDPDLPPEPSSPPFLPDAALRLEPPSDTTNGGICSCDACVEMRYYTK